MNYCEKPQGNCFSIGKYEIDLLDISKLKFKTPIRQITTTLSGSQQLPRKFCILLFFFLALKTSYKCLNV